MIFTLGLSFSPSIAALKALSFFVGIVNVTPQVLIPFAADLAPPDRRAATIAIVFSGLLLGVIFGRAIGGVIADVTGDWRNVYYVAVGLQSVALGLLWWVLPDWPSKVEIARREADEKGGGGQEGIKRLTYFGILGTMIKFAVTEPILIQGYIIGFTTQAVFSGFWVTLTFLLAEVYHYST